MIANHKISGTHAEQLRGIAHSSQCPTNSWSLWKVKTFDDKMYKGDCTRLWLQQLNFVIIVSLAEVLLVVGAATALAYIWNKKLHGRTYSDFCYYCQCLQATTGSVPSNRPRPPYPTSIPSHLFFCHVSVSFDRLLLKICCTELFGFFSTLSIVWYVEVLQKTTTFRRLDLSPSSRGWGRVDLLIWACQKELVSITCPTE
jgi:hypothetical protein